MAGADGRTGVALIDLLYGEPRRFEAFQAVLILERLAASVAAPGVDREEINVGEAANPATEAVQFSAPPLMSFPRSEIETLARTTAPGTDVAPARVVPRPRMAVTFFGLQGTEGVLPQHYTELLWRRVRGGDAGLQAFLDIFNHRATSLFVRAWKRHRLPTQAWASRAWEGEPGTPAAGIAGLIDSIIGFGTDGLRGRIAPPHQALRFYAGLIAGNPRSTAVLEAMLSDYFGEPISVETLIGRWEPIAPEAQTRLVPNGYCRLGDEAVIGARVLHPDGAFRVRLGPLSYARFRAFLPDRDLLRHLIHLVRLFAGEAMWFDVRPTLRREEVPPLQLGLRADGDGAMLGWNTWVLSRPATADRDDAILGCTLVA